MKSSDKVFISSWLIIMFFMICVVTGRTYAVSSETELQNDRTLCKFSSNSDILYSFTVYVEEDQERSDPLYELNGKCAFEMPLDSEDDMDLLVEDSDSFYGKDLYIFYIAQIVEQYYLDIDPYIVLAVLETESNYNPNIRSSAGAVGLMQVIPKYHEWRIKQYGLNNIWDPYTNIICGVDLLNDLYHKYGSWEIALFGYNHSQTYVKNVLSKADILRGGNYFGEAPSQDSGGS